MSTNLPPEPVELWPPLPYEAWKDTRQTLHMWLQMVGKIKLELCPFLNEWWQVAFHLTARGLSTGLIPWHDTSFDVEFDFVDHQLVVRVGDGSGWTLPLQPRSVADFYQLLMRTVASLGIQVTINSLPSEVPDGIRFEHDTAPGAYDGAAIQRWWRVMLNVARIVDQYRSPFRGKSSPVHFFWGGFDLAQSRFNGKLRPRATHASRIREFGEDEENFSVGMWPGNEHFPYAAVYAYMSPAPPHIEQAEIQPQAAHYDPQLGEFVLPYEDARRAASPEQAITAFFESTYAASAKLAGWDRQVLEGPVPGT